MRLTKENCSFCFVYFLSCLNILFTIGQNVTEKYVNSSEENLDFEIIFTDIQIQFIIFLCLYILFELFWFIRCYIEKNNYYLLIPLISSIIDLIIYIHNIYFYNYNDLLLTVCLITMTIKIFKSVNITYIICKTMEKEDNDLLNYLETIEKKNSEKDDESLPTYSEIYNDDKYLPSYDDVINNYNNDK